MEEETDDVRFGDWFAWAMTAATITLFLLTLRRFRQSRPS